MSLGDLYWQRQVPVKLPQWSRVTRTRIFQPAVMGIPLPVLLMNDADGGTNTTAVTTGNSGGGSGNAWDIVTITNNGTVTFDNTHVAHGALAYNIAEGASAGAARVTWSTSLTRSAPLQKIWFRAYIYFTGIPSAAIRIIRFFNGAVGAGFITVTNTGTVGLLDTNGSQITTTTNTIALNAWNRIEGFFIASSTAGQLSVSLYKTSPDSQTADETKTTAATQNTNGNIASVDFGNPQSLGSITFWMDELALSNTGPIGPSNTGPEQIAVQAGYRPRWTPHVPSLIRRGRISQPGWGQAGQGVQFPLWTRQGGYSPRWAPIVRGVKREGRFFQPGWGQGTLGSPFPTFIHQAGYRPRWKPYERIVSSRRRMWWPPQPLPYFIGANDADAVGSVVITVAVPTNPGDTIFVGAGSGGAATATGVTDSQGNKYQLVGSTGINSSNNSGYAFASFNANRLRADGTPDTITVTFSSAQNGQAAIAAGVPSGYALLDQVASAIGASSASPSVTTLRALSQPEALFAVLVSGNAGNAPAWNAGWSPLSTRHHAFGDAFTSMAFELASSGNITAGATITAANFAIVMVTLAQGQAFPTLIRRSGYSPLRWAPPPRVTRSRIFQPQMPQATQGVPFPTWTRQPGYSPKWAPAVRGVKREGRRFEPPWPQQPTGVQFPLFTRQPGYSPRWAPEVRGIKRQGQAFQPPLPQALVPYLYKLSPSWRLRWIPRIWRGRFLLPPMPQGAYQKPIWIRQPSYSPKWLPDRYPGRGRRFEPGWGQGTLGQPWPSVTRQPGWHPRWIPFIRQVRGRIFQPPPPVTDLGIVPLSGTGTLTAAALVTELPSALLAGQGTLGATAVLLIQGPAALNAAGTLTAAGTVGPTVSFTARGTLTVLTAFAGPDPANLWLIFTAAQRAADIAEKSWEETVIAGGTGGQSGMAYTRVYELQLASSQAYANWLAAHDAWLAAGEPGGGPG